MRKIHQFSVHPDIPERLSGLEELAFNLRWAWDRRAFKVFQHLDPELLEECGNNPVLLLRRVSKERLERATGDAVFLAHLDGAVDDLRRYLSEPGWFKIAYPDRTDCHVAYFCMEFGLSACLPIYSGGLGVLAGDHLKSAGELDLPLVAVGLLYHKGYFIQHLDEDGWQHESYRMLDFSTLPIRPVLNGSSGRACVPAAGAAAAASSPCVTSFEVQQAEAGGPSEGTPLRIHVDIAGRRVWARVWCVQVGRIPLYLLDTALPENDAEARRITGELYGGGTEERLAQEMVLGIGGVRALRALGIDPQVQHLNEGHTVFAALERVRGLMDAHGLTFTEARQAAGAGTLFTTHTPVPAGFDYFPEPLIAGHLGPYLEEMGIDVTDFMRMGRATADESASEFNVAALALRHAPRRNAVSRLHRRVTAQMMQPGWVDFVETDMPIDAITNGVHTKSWVAPEMEVLFDHYLGPRWRDDTAYAEAWQRVSRIPDIELWHTHTRLRERLVAYARELHRSQARSKKGRHASQQAAAPPLRSDALTIGFARRFATYKRATLLFKDVARLKAILSDETRPVQLLVAGKAHPRDGAGKDLIRNMLDIVRREGLTDRVVFLEDYDLSKGAILMQGVDVWLNSPRRPFEACGTSGMKVVPNGGLNLSVLDGWWAEGYEPGVGWAIGDEQEYAHHDYQDEVDAEALYSLLEREVVPSFYDRDADGVPRSWIAMMKQSIKTLAPAFSADRMVKEYAERFYLPAAAHYARVSADGFAKARDLAAWKARVRESWAQVRVDRVEEPNHRNVIVGEPIPVATAVDLGVLDPEDVIVQAFFARLRPDGRLGDGRGVELNWTECDNGLHLYRGEVPSRSSGLHGYSIRILPRHEDVLVPHELPLITWEQT